MFWNASDLTGSKTTSTMPWAPHPLYLLTNQKKTEQLGTTIRANNEELIPERLRNEKIMMIGETSLD